MTASNLSQLAPLGLQRPDRRRGGPQRRTPGAGEHRRRLRRRRRRPGRGHGRDAHAGGACHRRRRERRPPGASVELGATDTVNPADGDPVSALLELTAGLGAHARSRPAAGWPFSVKRSPRWLPPETCVVVGAPPLGSQIPVDVPNLLGRAFAWSAPTRETGNPPAVSSAAHRIRAGKAAAFDRLIRPYAFDQIKRGSTRRIRSTNKSSP